MEDKKKQSDRLDQYLDGETTPQEKAIIEEAYDIHFGVNREIYSEEEIQAATESAFTKIEAANKWHNTKKHRLLPYTAAAAVLAIFSIGYLFIDHKESTAIKTDAAITTQDVAPGGKYATLTLANGKQINLSQAPKGTVINSFINIQKSNEGEVVYTSSSNSISANLMYNTINTPKGGQFIVQLSDGSKVWLNAASQIKFPADFKGLKNRTVHLTGEAYFEVAKDPNHSFIVETATQRVEVLGTHFNINSYADEPTTKTTLLEGSVKITPTISTSLKSAILKPGQEANLHQDDKITIQKADVEAAASWKDGTIKVRNAELQTIMRQVSRWYNIDVVYKGTGKYERFSGTIPMNTNLSDLIRVLETKDLHFTIATNPERKLIVETKQ